MDDTVTESRSAPYLIYAPNDVWHSNELFLLLDASFERKTSSGSGLVVATVNLEEQVQTTFIKYSFI